MREQGLFCDVRIKLSNQNECPISVHRNVLASCSPFFRSLFTTALAESRQIEVKLPGISREDMDAVIKFAYTNTADLCPENIESILMTADRLHVFGLLKLCVDYLHDNTDPQNVIGIWNLANHFHCHGLVEKSWKYIIENFHNIVESSTEFLQFTVGHLCDVLRDDKLNLPNEDAACSAIMKWVDYHKSKRRRNFFQLLSCIRLAYVEKRTFDNVVLTDDDIVSQRTCKELLNQAYSLCQIQQNTKLSFYQASKLYILKPRIPHEVIFVLGGWTNESVCGHIETYDTRVNKWYSMRSSLGEQPLAYHALVPFGSYIYVIGGFTTYACVNTVRRFDPVDNTWTTAAPMHAKRCYVGCAVLDGFIYACGGYEGPSNPRHSSVERYNPVENQWGYVQSMKTVRSDAGVSELKGQLYVCGGFDGHTCLDTTEVYCPINNQWTSLESMSIQRSGVALTTLNGRLYAMGGFNGTRRLKTVERYDPNTKRWVMVGSMSLARSNFAVTLLQGKIVSLGGFNGSTTSSIVECYDEEKDEWTERAGLTTGRSATSACTVKGLSNVTDYTYYGADTNN
ncbi:kelch-like protein 10 [Patella vulgata]|uniref:kelch-like protein 10 n=1 Tax=Patella vulgata TaxID=6465 RepID=UPI0024A7C514|nr:kelch-like protein 10 [Patella vulgata]